MNREKFKTLFKNIKGLHKEIYYFINGKSEFCEFCKSICEFNIISMPIIAGLFLRLDKFILKFEWKRKKNNQDI